MIFETNQGSLNETQLFDALDYACYKFNRNGGMSADQMGSKYLFGPVRGAALEARYQQEQTAAA